MVVLTGNILADAFARAGHGRVVMEGDRISDVALASEHTIPGEPWVLPGLIDSHTHPVGTGLESVYPDLRNAGSLGEVTELLRSSLPRCREDGALRAYNLDPERLLERRLPFRGELDAVVGSLPAIVYRIDGHSASLSSAAMALLEQPWLPVVETDESGLPTGVVAGAAYERVADIFTRLLTPDTIRETLRHTSELALSRGTTTIAAMVGSPSYGPAEWRMMVDSLACARVTMVPFLQAWDAAAAVELGLPRIGGCLLIDGSFGSRTAALEDYYADQPGNSGVCYENDQRILGLLASAQRRGLQTAFHAIGDRAVGQVLSCHESLGPAREKDPRHRIEHAELLSPQLVERISRLGIVLGVQPAFETTWGGPRGMYARRLGARWARTNPLRTLADAGIRLAGGSDSPITPLDPLAGIRSALTLPNAEQRLDGPAALAMFGTWAAFSMGIENRVGALRPGMDADVVLLDGDPRTGVGCRVLATYKRGVRVFAERQ